jgi:hypothetical protein
MDVTNAVPVHTQGLCVLCATGRYGDDLSVMRGHGGTAWADGGGGGGGGEAASE